MEKKDVLTKILAVAGTVLIWFPILAPVLFFAAGILRAGIVRVDFLMAAELFPSALLGGALLIWAAWRAHLRLKLAAWGFGIAVFSLVAGQVLAVVTGLASGETEPAGLAWILVLASIGAYSLALVLMGVAGIWLLRDLFRYSQPQAESPTVR